MYIGHYDRENNRIQTIKEHSENTADLCEKFSIPIMKKMMYQIGLIHDIGKYQHDFQERIKGANIRAPHALCGAKTAKEHYGSTGTALIMQCVIAGHHTGLLDCGDKSDTPDKSTLFGMVKRDTQDYSAFCDELKLILDKDDFVSLDAFISQNCQTREELCERFAFMTRYCFSCLTDADWLDTEEFFKGESRRELTADFELCLQEVNKVLDSFKCTTELQKARARLQNQVFTHVGDNSSIFLMNMPTGSGKTLCSIKFALEQAIKKGRKRIIYIIPYNSIIEQTAQTFKDIFGDYAQILRHQSTYSFEDELTDNEEDAMALKQGTENWDAQIILTTAVQFFESVYSNKRSKLRKLHNMANSILIFDEAHLMPIDYLQPCLRAIHHITEFLNSEALLLTATMPHYDYLFRTYADKNVTPTALITDMSDFSYFKKAEFEYIPEISYEKLIAQAVSLPSSLIVVSTRATAQKLYNMNTQCKCYHLSTYMTSYDRTKKINEIKAALSDLSRDYPDLNNVPMDRRIMVVSTSLIEAGVDLDFYTVFRELAGLDNLLQAGGRCNREGKRENAKVYVFEASETLGKSKSLEQSTCKGIIEGFKDISSPESILSYYERLLNMRRDDIVKNSLGTQCSKATHIPFNSYAKQFEIIESNTISIAVVRDDVSKKLYSNLEKTGQIDTRAAQVYTCSVYEKEFTELQKLGVVNDYGSGVYWLTNLDYYDENTGIKFEGQDIFL